MSEISAKDFITAFTDVFDILSRYKLNILPSRRGEIYCDSCCREIFTWSQAEMFPNLNQICALAQVHEKEKHTIALCITCGHQHADECIDEGALKMREIRGNNEGW